MIATEEEAARKVCPFAVSFNASHGRRVIAEGGYTRREHDHATCIGSRCMAWDWYDNEKIMPQSYIDLKGDGIHGPAGIWLRQGYLTPESNEHTPETKEEYHERIIRVRTEEGFTRNEKMAVDSTTAWTKPHPNRRGQCGRTPIVEISQG